MSSRNRRITTLRMESLERRDMLAASMELVADMDVNADARHPFVAGESTYQVVEYKDENGTDFSSVGRIDNGAPQAVEFSGRLALLQAGKYSSQQAATFEEGDFNGDGLFNQQDLVAALQTGSYLQGPNSADTESDHHDV